jgi:hypothetical protein
MRCRARYFAAVAAAAAMAAGCSSTVSGTAQRSQLAVPDPGRNYGYADNRCGLLHDDTVQQILDAVHIVRPYSGAVCQYVLMRGSEPPVTIDATFSWFETGTLEREHDVVAGRGATVTDTDVERHPGFLARHDTTGAACSATAAAGTGVASWWVQFRGQSNGDPCAEAKKLLSATLKSDL